MGLTGGGGGEGGGAGCGADIWGEGEGRGRSLNTVQCRDGKTAGADPKPTLPVGRPAPLGSASSLQ